jgi:hypothetical protein
MWVAAGLLFAGQARADRFVALSGNTPDGVYSNWTTAATNIQQAVNVAVTGETVWVGDGTYYSTGGVNGSVSITKAITLRSQNGAGATIIDGNYPTVTNNRCLHMTSSGAVVDGFTIRNGNYPPPSNSLKNGPGVYMSAGQLLNCVVTGNRNDGYNGGGVYMTGGTLTNCTVSSNMLALAGQTQWGAGICMNGGILIGCTIRDNMQGANTVYGGGVFVSGGYLTNCVIRDNVMTNIGSGGGVYVSSGGGILVDCTVSGNSTTNANLSGAIYLSGASTVTACRVTNNFNKIGGGIYIYSGASVVSNCLVAGNTGYNGAGGMVLNAAGSVVTDCIVSNNVAQTGNQAGGLYVSGAGRVTRCVVVNNSGYNGGVTFSGDNSLLEDSTIANNTATNAGFGGGIWGGGGTTTNILIRNCAIANNRSSNHGGGINLNYGGVTVSNCTIVGNAAGAGSYGGGVYFRVAGDRVLDSVIASNSTPTIGGGVYLATDGELRNCLIVSNVAGASAGVHVQAGSPVIQSCTIARNTSTNSASAYAGGVMSLSSGLRMTNCIIYGNYSTATTTNWSNNATNMAYCCTTPTNGLNGSAAGNIQADPKFVDPAAGDFSLQAESPCIDKGLNQDWMTNAVDLGGKPRIVNGVVDMGAYEYLSLLPRGSLITIR